MIGTCETKVYGIGLGTFIFEKSYILLFQTFELLFQIFES